MRIRPRRRISYLELSQGETTAGADTAVVLKGRASHNRSELVDRSGSEGSSLGLTSCASPRLLAGLFHSQYLCAKVNFQKIEMNRFFSSLLVGCIVIPGRSGFEPGAANPCGSLLKESVPQILYHIVIRGWCGSRLLTSFWLCLIACSKSGQQMRMHSSAMNIIHRIGRISIPLCLLAINVLRWSMSVVRRVKFGG